MKDQAERQRGFDGNLGVLQLPSALADAHGLPRGDRFRRQPQGDVASLDQGSVVRRPVSDAVFRFVPGMHSRLHVEIMPLRPSRWPGPRRTLVSAHQRRRAPPCRPFPRFLEDAELLLPLHMRHALASVREEVRAIEARIAALERDLRALADADPVVRRLREIPGIGLLTATALVGTVGHIGAFRRARQFASWLGLTPREHSSGHRRRLGGITKHGDRYLRCLLTHGARAVLISAQRQRSRAQPLSRLHHWAVTLRDRRGHNKATIAVANKLGRLAWAVWAKDVPYTMPRAA